MSYICDLCYYNNIDYDSYGAWQCANCGQQYEYDERPIMVLNEHQLDLLRNDNEICKNS